MGKPRMVLVGGRFVPVEGEKAKAKEFECYDWWFCYKKIG